jgi:hypothetical protein
MQAFIQFFSGEIHTVSLWNGYDMSQLLDNVAEFVSVDADRVIFYNADYERIDDYEAYVTPGVTYHVVVLESEVEKPIDDDSFSRAE